MHKKLILFAILVLTWLVLSGFFSPLFICFALFSCAVVTIVRSRMQTDNDDLFPLSFLLNFPAYLTWLIKAIFISTYGLTKKVWQPRLSINPVFAWVPTGQKNSTGMVSIANSITLTPGTVTVIVRGNQIGVHALDQSSIDELWEGDMDKRVTQLSKEV
jgi:multicomponent Na+:H+ antiporter subunit E